MNKCRDWAAVVVLAVLCGCATITRGTKEVLVIESEPIGAKVTTSIGLVGTTPATFKVSRKGGFTVTIDKEGYQPVTVQVSSQVAGAGAAGMAGNIVLGGLIGAAVDAGTGATKQLKPNPVKVTLVPLGLNKETSEEGTSESSKTKETPVDENTPTPEMKEESVSFQVDIWPLEGDQVLVSVIGIDQT